MSSESDALSTATVRFYGNVSHWTASRWAAELSAGVSRADAAYDLVQRIADLAADTEGTPHRQVPRLPNDLALGDQLRVVVADLIAASPSSETLASALSLVNRASATILGCRPVLGGG